MKCAHLRTTDRPLHHFERHRRVQSYQGGQVDPFRCQDTVYRHVRDSRLLHLLLRVRAPLASDMAHVDDH